MVKFWVMFALIVAAIGALSNCESPVGSNPFHMSMNFGHGAGESGSGVAKSETRQVGEFRRIHAEGSGTLDVEVAPGAATGTIEISGDDNLLGFYRTEVQDGVLEIVATASISPKTTMRLKVATPLLDAVHLEGANKMNLAIDSTRPLEVHIEGAGRVNASGKVPEFTVHTEGAGSIDADQLVAGTVDIHVEGAGRAKVHATDVLRANIEGAGSITYKGDPKTVEKNIDGFGRISRAD